MSAKKPAKGLGRGFESLIPSDFFDETFDPTAETDEQVSDLKQLPLSKIVADPDQPRQHFDETALAELSASIKTHGVLQPIVVTPKDDGFIIVAGERRFRASKHAGLDKIPALIRTLDAQTHLELALIENVQRRDLNVLETATAYAKLRDQFNLSLEQIGARVGGKSVSAISNTLRLLKLPSAVKTALHNHQLSEGQARPLIGIDDDTIGVLLPQIIDGALSARAVEALVKSTRGGEKHGKSADDTAVRGDFSKLETALEQKFNAPISVRKNHAGKGTIAIRFSSDEEFERITRQLEN